MQLTIRDVAFGGKGVGRAGGLAVFVPFTIPGEQVSVEITRRKKSYAEADLISIDVPSPDRVEPKCPYFGRCGGCSYQHMGYPAQLTVKATQVEQTLRRIGKFAEVPMRPVVPAPQPYGYRNRIRIHIAAGVIGFYSADSNTLLDIKHCPIASPEVNERLTALRSRLMPDGDYTLAEQRKKGYFEQTNNEVAKEMLDLVDQLLTRGGTLVDAYCGAGFFARHLREHFEQVVGLEENDFAVQHARSHAAPNELYVMGDVSVQLPEVLAKTAGAATSLILDPPAAGVTPGVIETILAARPREIIYVSCNPATLARDLVLLCRGYRLESVTPLDMFPQTAEIEAVACLRPLIGED